MKLLTASLEGKALDWALAKALEYEPQVQFDHVFVPALKRGWPISGVVPFDHTDPALCLGLIEQYKPDLVYRAELWGAEIPHTNNQFWSSSLSRAVARCVVQMRLGDEVEVPSEFEELEVQA